uniref:Uncharacterized protein n=1 Tax=Lepeophtheirus salmonis TaxID=72036 RepID=A0A0K2U9T2_LEPSM
MIHDMEWNIAENKDLGYIINKIGMLRVRINYVNCIKYHIPLVNSGLNVVFNFERLQDYSSIITKT